MFNDPRQSKPTHSYGELNCDRWAFVDDRLFMASKSCGTWEVKEIAYNNPMLAEDEDLWKFCLWNLNDVRKAIAEHIIEFPMEDAESHWQRVRARTLRSIALIEVK